MIYALSQAHSRVTRIAAKPLYCYQDYSTLEMTSFICNYKIKQNNRVQDKDTTTDIKVLLPIATWKGGLEKKNAGGNVVLLSLTLTFV